MSELVIEGLRARVGGQEILTGVDLAMASGEVHAVMGPNGSGKSTLAHVLAGRPGCEVLGGSARLDGIELLDLPAWERAQAGLFLAMQYPTEVPGVALRDLLRASVSTSDNAEEIESSMRAEAERIGFDEKFLERPLNVDLSGGEKKRNETLQLGVLCPRFAILDELDSGLDFDALRLVGARVEAATEEDSVGGLAITHYSRLFEQLRPEHCACLCRGPDSTDRWRGVGPRVGRHRVTNVGVMRHPGLLRRRHSPKIRLQIPLRILSPIRSLELCRWGRLLPWLELC